MSTSPDMTNKPRKLPPIRPTESEKTEWRNFESMAQASAEQNAGTVSEVIRMELERLVRKGNPLAARFASSIAPPPAPHLKDRKRRFSGVRLTDADAGKPEPFGDE